MRIDYLFSKKATGDARRRWREIQWLEDLPRLIRVKREIAQLQHPVPKILEHACCPRPVGDVFEKRQHRSHLVSTDLRLLIDVAPAEGGCRVSPWVVDLPLVKKSCYRGGRVERGRRVVISLPPRGPRVVANGRH